MRRAIHQRDHMLSPAAPNGKHNAMRALPASTKLLNLHVAVQDHVRQRNDWAIGRAWSIDSPPAC